MVLSAQAQDIQSYDSILYNVKYSKFEGLKIDTFYVEYFEKEYGCPRHDEYVYYNSEGMVQGAQGATFYFRRPKWDY